MTTVDHIKMLLLVLKKGMKFNIMFYPFFRTVGSLYIHKVINPKALLNVSEILLTTLKNNVFFLNYSMFDYQQYKCSDTCIFFLNYMYVYFFN